MVEQHVREEKQNACLSLLSSGAAERKVITMCKTVFQISGQKEFEELDNGKVGVLTTIYVSVELPDGKRKPYRSFGSYVVRDVQTAQANQLLPDGRCA